MVCQQCGKVNDPDAVFCVQCSQPLLHSCPSCSTQNAVDALFCKKCGTALADASASEQADRLQSLQDTAPKSLQEKLHKADTEIEGQRKPVTILFADIVGSTSIAEKLDPEEWKEVVQGAHQRVSEAIHRYEGTIAQLLGDGVMAFFGAPLTHEDDPERAVRAGLDIQSSIEEYRGELAGFVDEFQMRVGIHAGEVVVGPVGSDEHTEYLALGDAVNIAARLEAAALPGTVLVSETCAKHIQHVFEFDDFKLIRAKGKSNPVRAASVLGMKAKPDLARGLGGFRSPFVGREIELAQVQAALLALCQGQGQIIILLGEAGIGKTRLLEQAHLRSCSGEAEYSTTHFDPRTIRWLEGRALSYGSSLSFWTINQLLLNDLGLSDGAPRVKIKAALRQRTLALFGEKDAPHVLPYLSHLLDLSFEGPEAKPLKHMDGEAIKYQTLIYLKDYFEHLAMQVPTVLVLEDLNWADPSSLEALEKLLPLTDRVPLLFALLMRVDREHGA
jgi:class 3 adenylate cyclase/ribosomal protein L40E